MVKNNFHFRHSIPFRTEVTILKFVQKRAPRVASMENFVADNFFMEILSRHLQPRSHVELSLILADLQKHSYNSKRITQFETTNYLANLSLNLFNTMGCAKRHS